jgi:hypothetical protein
MKHLSSSTSLFIRLALGALLVPCWTPTATAAGADDASVVERRLADSAKYLASDALEGRGVGTKGLDLAADYIAERFRQIGLKTDLFDGGPFQEFKMTVGATLGTDNRLAFIGPAADGGPAPTAVELKVGEQFNPLSIGGSGKFDLPLVFVGYGITAKDENYDDYAGIDVRDKAVIILRHQPQQSNPHASFGGPTPSKYAPFKRKISNAYEHGAAAVIFCNDEFDLEKNQKNLQKRWQTAVDDIAKQNTKFAAIARPSAEDQKQHEKEIEKLAADITRFSESLKAAGDPLLPFDSAGPDASEGRDFPVLFCQRGPMNQIVKAALNTSLDELERQIDNGPTPHSRALTGWRALGQTSVERQQVEVKNVVGVLEGDGPLAQETIVLGAHYDHLGWGGAGSAAPGAHEIHNGADDNGSGTSVLLEVARQLADRSGKLPRRMVFVAFTGEERGLIGSARYVRNPLFPLDSTVAMLNMDMVGRLQNEKLIVHGTGTATEFDALVDRLGKQDGFEITKKPGGFGPSDHSSFYAAQIPVLFFFTGSHKDYHRPTDDFDLLNVAGMRRVADLVVEMTVALAVAPERPHYQDVKGAAETLGGGGDRPYFGSIPDFSQEQPGYALTGVTKGGPAERGGLKAGDIIIQLGDSKIGNLEDFDSALRKYKAGDKVPVIVKRAAEQVKLEVTLDPPR